ncbi:PKD domain-containing protein, partial [Candidatus Amoebophilus asiaticus]|nr:PKD domain-containing protein [Candidatus Amoebophilus asiaticus]
GDNGFQGFYSSYDSGDTWTTEATSPNLLGWKTNGSDNGGQGWYDLSLAASPLNANEIYVGGVNVWKSTNGGSSWNISGYWKESFTVDYVHADIHALEYVPNTSIIMAGCDGGVYKSTNFGTDWEDLSNGLSIMQFYRMGASATDSAFLLAGSQDNGTSRYESGVWDEVLGGDGMEAMVDYNDKSIVFGTLYYGEIHRSYNGGNSFSEITPLQGTTPIQGNWVTPFAMHPNNSNIILGGYGEVYKTTNRGNSWSAISSLSSGNIRALVFAPSDGSVIYASTYYYVFKTTNGGSNWTGITGTLPTSSVTPTYIAVHETDPNTLWITFSGYINGEKVYKTTDGGSTWTNISGSLPNIPVNCIVYENGSDDAIYIGTDLGVFYTNNNFNDWEAYSEGLPNVVVNELEIFYPGNKIKAATYGRGIWEAPLYQPAAPSASISSSNNILCDSSLRTVYFYDESTYNPSSWYWIFEGGNPDTSVGRNPCITYSSPGLYDVTLIISNQSGADTLFMDNYVTIGDKTIASFTLNSDTVFLSDDGSVNFSNNSNNAQNYLWDFGDGNTSNSETPNHNYSEAGDYTVQLVAINGNCSDTSTSKITVLKVGGSAEPVTIYPNPGGAQFNITFNFSTATDVEIEVYNSLGQLLSSKIYSQIKYKNETVDLSDQKKGIYYFKFKYNDEVIKERFVLTQ